MGRAATAAGMTPGEDTDAGISRVYELVVYANDDHAITANRIDRTRRIVEWFRTHMRPAPEASR